MKKILFVCLGNICRSPAAEGITKKILKDHGMENSIFVDSAGTSGWHQGKKADSRMKEYAKKRGVELESISRQLNEEDFENFDLIFCMDNSNYNDVIFSAQSEEERKKVHKICSFAKNFKDKEVPDPYYGGPDGFEYVFELLQDACMNIFYSLIKK